MSIVNAQNISLAFGLRPLLHDVSFCVDKSEKIALLGRNGEGKSSLLKVLNREIQVDSGNISFAQNIKIALVAQDPIIDENKTAFEILRNSLAEIYQVLNKYEQLLSAGENASELEEKINTLDAWNLPNRINAVLEKFSIKPNEKISNLSGGKKRKLCLASAVVDNPDILLLDEPTNHLDINAINDLEKFIQSFTGSVICVTHDRKFMENTAERIWELDRGRLLDLSVNYQKFLQTKEQLLHSEELANRAFDKKLAQEEIWIRKGIEARRTRNEGRVRALKEMRAQRKARIEKQKIANFSIDAGEKSGKQVVVLKDVNFGYSPDNLLINNFSDIIERGEKIALIGGNGVGKSTLIKLICGELNSLSGEIIRGSNLQIRYFDQLREALDPKQTLRDSVGEGAEYLELNGKKQHIASYLQDFLFSPQRWNTPVASLSGGERARLMFAKLFATPSNFLVLDEPSNDLDIETLELLEELLAQYSGTVIIASHDRELIDKTATRSFVFNRKNQKIEKIIGGFTDWINAGGNLEDLNENLIKQEELGVCKNRTSRNKPANKEKLSYKEKRELEDLNSQISQTEAELANLTAEINREEFHKQPHEEQKIVYDKLDEVQNLLDKMISRWIELEEINNKTLS